MRDLQEMFRAKIRKVGTSLGLLIPRDVIKEKEIEEGEEVQVDLTKQRNPDDVMKLFGIARGAPPYKKDKADRADRLEKYK